MVRVPIAFFCYFPRDLKMKICQYWAQFVTSALTKERDIFRHISPLTFFQARHTNFFSILRGFFSNRSSYGCKVFLVFIYEKNGGAQTLNGGKKGSFHSSLENCMLSGKRTRNGYERDFVSQHSEFFPHFYITAEPFSWQKQFGTCANFSVQILLLSLL